MNGFCREPSKDDDALRDKISDFISDRSTEMVIGSRRMGHDALVDMVAEMFGESGMDCTVGPDTGGKDAVIFRTYGEASSFEGDGVDVMFG